MRLRTKNVPCSAPGSILQRNPFGCVRIKLWHAGHKIASAFEDLLPIVLLFEVVFRDPRPHRLPISAKVCYSLSEDSADYASNERGEPSHIEHAVYRIDGDSLKYLDGRDMLYPEKKDGIPSQRSNHYDEKPGQRMSDQAAEDAGNNSTAQGKLTRSDDEEPPEEGANQQGSEGSSKREHHNTG